MRPLQPLARAAFAVGAVLGCALWAASPLAAQQGNIQDEYLRAAAEHFRIPSQEVVVLARWGLSPGEIPVVLFLARQAGVSPDVVVAQRRRGSGWMEIAAGYSVHAGDFYVAVSGPTGFLAPAYERYASLGPSQWSSVSLSDQEVVGLVNVRFLSRHLARSPARVIQELGSGGAVSAYGRLRN